MDDAVCAQSAPDAWFPEGVGNNGGVEAKRVCATCPVRLQCIDYAVRAAPASGIWGGLSIHEIRRLRTGMETKT